MVGNLNDMNLGQQYDYVVVNGVLEYAMSFTEGDTPYETFLGKMGSYLKNTGKLLIAIENKLGMKYFAGPRKIIRTFPSLESMVIRKITVSEHFPKQNCRNL